MTKTLRNVGVVSALTSVSRVLGLARDVLMFAALGAGLWNSAFVLAFTLPNLFRRLFGEGALSSALVPVFSDVLGRDGRAGAFGFLNQVLSRLALVLAALVLCGVAALGAALAAGWVPGRWVPAAGLSAVLLPYMLLICTAAVVSSGLHLFGRFAAAASSPVFLNLAMIAALSAALALGADAVATVGWLCAGVLAGGCLQLLVPSGALAREGWRPRWSAGSGGADLAALWRLFLPGVMGAAILQLNILVSRLLAYSLDDSAASLLYLSSRLMELPLGLFTAAVATVFFPLLARAESMSDATGFAEALGRGMRLAVALSLAAGVGLAVLAGPVLRLLFEWGAYDSADVRATVPLVVIYGLGLPFYSAATLATRGLHAAKDMRTPVRVAGICLLVNAFAGVVWMRYLGAAGLAAANVAAAAVQALLLCGGLRRPGRREAFAGMAGALARIVAAGLLMGALCGAGLEAVRWLGLAPKTEAAVAVAVLVPGGAVLYFALLAVFRFRDMDALRGLLARGLRRRR